MKSSRAGHWKQTDKTERQAARQTDRQTMLLHLLAELVSGLA